MEERKEEIKEEETTALLPEVDKNDLVPTCSYICIKSIITVAAVTGLFLNTVYGFAFPEVHPQCVSDSTFKLTSSVNKYLSNTTKGVNAMLIVSSVLLDSLFLVFACMWTVNGKSWRPVFAMLTYYLLRILCIFVHQFKVPDGYLWNYPGFPSLLVSYTRTNDFFFSSFLGITLILALEFKLMRQFILFSVSLALLLYQAIILVFLRGNYIIDILTAILFAHFVHWHMGDLTDYLEKKGILTFSDSEDDLTKRKIEL